MEPQESIVERIRSDLSGLWLVAVGIALLTTATSSMRFTAMLGIYPLEVSLLIRHLVSFAALVVCAIWLARSGPISNRHWEYLGIWPMIALSVCLTLSNIDPLVGGGLGIPSYIANVIAEALGALALACWIGLLLPHGARKTLAVFGISVVLHGLTQLTTCWLQYVPHLVLISTLPLLSSALFAVCVRTADGLTTGCTQGLASACGQAAGVKGLPRFLAMLLLLFCLMFIVGHIIYMSLDTQQAMAGSVFAEVSMGVGNALGGLFILFIAYRLAESPSISVALFVVVAAIALAYYLTTFATGLSVGIYLAISSAVLQTLYALVQYFAARAFPSKPQDARLMGYLFTMTAALLARCLSSAFMIGHSAGGTIAYNIAVAVTLAGSIACCIILMQDAGPADMPSVVTAGDMNGIAAQEPVDALDQAIETTDDDAVMCADETEPEPDSGHPTMPELDDESSPADIDGSDAGQAPHPTPFRDAIDAAAADARLTPQERNVLVLLAQGRNARSISDTMTLSMNTVRSHMRNVYAKLAVHSQQELIDAINERVDEIRKTR